MSAYEPSRIKPLDWVFMIIVALFYDGLQAAITAIFAAFVITAGIGPFLSSIAITPFAFLTFFLWFKMKGMKFTRWTKVTSFGSGTFIELTPLSFLPGWTASVVATLIIDRLEKIKNLAPLKDEKGGNKTKPTLKRLKK